MEFFGQNFLLPLIPKKNSKILMFGCSVLIEIYLPYFWMHLACDSIEKLLHIRFEQSMRHMHALCLCGCNAFHY